MHELHSRLYEEGKNSVTFPLGIASMLGLAANGSGGNTRREILRVLGISKDSDVESLNSLLSKAIEGTSKLGRIRSGLMVCRGTKGSFTPESNIVSDTVFLSSLAAMDYSRSDAINPFNGWVRHVTENKLNGVFDELDEDSSIILIYAGYASSLWRGGFRQAGQMGFNYGKSGLPLAADFLIGDHVELQDGPKWDFLKVNYEPGSKISMIIIRPKSGDLGELCRDWDLEDFLAPAMPDVQPGRSVSLAMPKFKIATVLDDRLKLALVDCGLTDAVVPGIADFTGLIEGDPDAHLSKIVQAAAINVDAAARNTNREPERMGRYVLDSPFLAMMIDEATMLPICMANVVNPNLS